MGWKPGWIVKDSLTISTSHFAPFSPTAVPFRHLLVLLIRQCVAHFATCRLVLRAEVSKMSLDLASPGLFFLGIYSIQIIIQINTDFVFSLNMNQARSKLAIWVPDKPMSPRLAGRGASRISKASGPGLPGQMKLLCPCHRSFALSESHKQVGAPNKLDRFGMILVSNVWYLRMILDWVYHIIWNMVKLLDITTSAQIDHKIVIKFLCS